RIYTRNIGRIMHKGLKPKVSSPQHHSKEVSGQFIPRSIPQSFSNLTALND
ncbi:Unknown protein, partial [Striga hermonthica]